MRTLSRSELRARAREAAAPGRARARARAQGVVIFTVSLYIALVVLLLAVAAVKKCLKVRRDGEGGSCRARVPALPLTASCCGAQKRPYAQLSSRGLDRQRTGVVPEDDRSSRRLLGDDLRMIYRLIRRR